MNRKQNSGITREAQGNRIIHLLTRVLKPKAMLFGLVMFHFVVRLISVIRFQAENEFIVASGWDPVVAMTRPFLLLLGSVCLFIDRLWSCVVAILLAGNIIYSNGYRGLAGISYAHGIPMFGVGALRIWFEIMNTTQIINTGLAVVILIFGMIQLSRRLARRILGATTTEAQSPTIG